MKSIDLEWEIMGDLYEVYMDISGQYGISGPLVYCACVVVSPEFRENVSSEDWNEWYHSLLADRERHQRITGDNLRYLRFRDKLEEIQPADGDLFLLYIGLVEGKEDHTLGTRLFESHDPAANFSTYYLRFPPNWVFIGMVNCGNIVPNYDLEDIESYEIFHHKPPLNLRKVNTNPCQPGTKIRVRNKWTQESLNQSPALQLLLSKNFIITDEL